MRKTALEGLVADALTRVDREERRGPDHAQQLFPWADMDGVYALGNGQRVAKRAARLFHMEAAAAISAANYDAVARANHEVQDELARLRPHFPPGGTKDQALAAYAQANPPSAVG